VNVTEIFRYFVSRPTTKHVQIILLSHNINIDVSDTIRKFYAAANAIAYRTRRVNEMARLSLFEAFTLPILCYGCEGYILQIRF